MDDLRGIRIYGVAAFAYEVETRIFTADGITSQVEVVGTDLAKADRSAGEQVVVDFVPEALKSWENVEGTSGPTEELRYGAVAIVVTALVDGEPFDRRAVYARLRRDSYGAYLTLEREEHMRVETDGSVEGDEIVMEVSQ